MKKNEDGQKIFGESNISESKKLISRIGYLPENPSALPSALESIKEADLIIFGPGSLYTLLLPNLLVPEIVDALLKSAAQNLYK